MKAHLHLFIVLLFVVFLATLAFSKCPFGFDEANHVARRAKVQKLAFPTEDYVRAALELDWDAVYSDIQTLLASNYSDIYPPDDMLDGTTSYGPFFIRQAWHCSGSYRQTDGLGGCAGGRQRFDPELSWPDNTNLDKAKRLLWPIKEKYGLGLSWGDLMILTGKVAIESGNGPFIGFCAGRPDQEDGSQSELLGPNTLQQADIPCPEQGACPYPFGSDTIGLIYVNPGGYLGDYTRLEESAAEINRTFGFMSMDAAETVALIGGGHAFGKTHGACRINASDFPSPMQDPANPWPITICPNGTYTAGFEGYWTKTPKQWSNGYFLRLTQFDFVPELSPGGNYQYVVAGENDNRMMLATDMSLLADPLYESLVQEYAANFSYLSEMFGAAWYKLTTRDMGPISRCLNITIGGRPQLPPAQPFQYPLPPPPATLPDFDEVTSAILSSLQAPNPNSSFLADTVDGKPYWGALFIHLAFQCAATYRSTDHLGGCNGARIMLAPQNGWVFNNGTDTVLEVLDDNVKQMFDDSLTWADLIVLAGTVALEEATGVEIPFCPGRSDATESYPALALKPGFNLSDVTLPAEWDARVLGLSNEEYVAIAARPRSPHQMLRMHYIGASWNDRVDVISNEYFQVLLSNNASWTPVEGPSGVEYVDASGQRFMTPTDMRILWDPTLKGIAQDFASDNQLFLQYFVSAWVNLMTNDRYEGPLGNVCDHQH